MNSNILLSQPISVFAYCLGMGHQYYRQQTFFQSQYQHYLRHGGELRKKRLGRKRRPLSTKDPLHVVFKINKEALKFKSLRSPKNFVLVMSLVKTYALHFAVKVEQISIQYDHIHLLVRAPRRSQFHSFFRVLSGQIAQAFQSRDLLVEQRTVGCVTDTPKTRCIESNKVRLWRY